MDKTLREMGIRSKKAISHHLLADNVYESNLLVDIAGEDYTAGHAGRTHLQALDGLPPFVDDIYVFGFLQPEDCVYP